MILGIYYRKFLDLVLLKDLGSILQIGLLMGGHQIL